MGFSMCKHLMKAGNQVSVYNRTMSKAQGLIDLGAKASDPISIAKEVDYLYLIVSFPEDVERMTICPQNGILKHMKKGSFIIDHTTSSPSLAKKIEEEAKKYGVYSYDIPVVGGDLGAKNGTLNVMAGGDKEKFSEVEQTIKPYCQNIRYCGEAGSGQQTKLINQIILGHNITGVCEAIIFAYKAGLDVKETINYLAKGSAASTQLSFYFPRMEKRDFEPGFYAEHFLKDLKLAVEECDRMGIKLKNLELVTEMFDVMCKEGFEKKGHHGLLLLLEKMNKLKAILVKNWIFNKLLGR